MFLSLKDIWTPFVVNEAKTWTFFHEYWLKIQSQIPVLFVRYEDLVENPPVCVSVFAAGLCCETYFEVTYTGLMILQAVMSKVKTFMLEGRPPLGLKRFLRNLAAVAATGPGYEPKKVCVTAVFAPATDTDTHRDGVV